MNSVDEIEQVLRNKSPKEKKLFWKNIQVLLTHPAFSALDLSRCLIHEVNTGATGYSDCRVMIDCETENRQLWMDYKVNGESLHLEDDDLIIKK